MPLFPLRCYRAIGSCAQKFTAWDSCGCSHFNPTLVIWSSKICAVNLACGGVGLAPFAAQLRLAALKSLDDDLGKQASELPDVAAKCDNLPDQAAAGQGKLFTGHDENGLDVAHGTV